MGFIANPFQGNLTSRNRAKNVLAKEKMKRWIATGAITGREALNDILRNKKLVHEFRNEIAAKYLCRIPYSHANKYGNEFGVSEFELRDKWRFKASRDQLFYGEHWLYMDADKVRKAATNVTAKVTRVVRDIIGRMDFVVSDSPSPSASASPFSEENDEQKREIDALRGDLRFLILEQRLIREQMAIANDNNADLEQQLDRVTSEKEALEDQLDQIRYKWNQAKAYMNQ